MHRRRFADRSAPGKARRLERRIAGVERGNGWGARIVVVDGVAGLIARATARTAVFGSGVAALRPLSLPMRLQKGLQMATLLTGASGFLGGYLLRAMIERGEEVIALVRGEDGEEARGKLAHALARAGADGIMRRSGGAVGIALGDLARPGLGLGTRDRERIRSECDRILHCGATVRFRESTDRARAVNLGATLSLLDLARRRPGGVSRFDHVSTAFVAGRRTDIVREDELDGGCGHRNAYERTKFEAETAVRAAASDLPVTIVRPSIVVGESHSGRTDTFRTVYGPIRLYARGVWRTCPAHPDLPVDLVPVDFVARAIMAIRDADPPAGRCFHVAAGPPRAMPARSLAALVERAFPGRGRVRFVRPALWAAVAQPILRRVRFGRIGAVVHEGSLYLPYLAGMPRFDVTNAEAALRPSGIEIPSVQDYVERILDYCARTDFGTRPSDPASGPERCEGATSTSTPGRGEAASR